MHAVALFTLLLALIPGLVSAQAKAPPPGTVEHDDALRRAQVWFEPATPIEKAGLGENPPGDDTYSPDEEVVCSFTPDFVSGSTPKFECERSNGKKVKVKYGRDNAEIYAEVVGSRLLAALGFPADRMYVVKRVRCFGCPPDPFEGLQCLNEGKTVENCFSRLDHTKYTDFDYAVIERRLKGEKLETRKVRGWGWNELSKIDPAAGGASRAQVDALRLLAVFLNHRDNKPKNQRVLCLDEDEPPTGTLPECHRPVAMVQALGATFGPDKFNLDNWAKTPIWDNPATCAVSMRALPYGGSSFPDTRISEAGRQFLASRLVKLSSRQLSELFEGARVSRYPQENSGAKSADQWVHAFEQKVRAIADRPPCPSAP
jgi:hypothetical protein